MRPRYNYCGSSSGSSGEYRYCWTTFTKWSWKNTRSRRIITINFVFILRKAFLAESFYHYFVPGITGDEREWPPHQGQAGRFRCQLVLIKVINMWQCDSENLYKDLKTNRPLLPPSSVGLKSEPVSQWDIMLKRDLYWPQANRHTHTHQMTTRGWQGRGVAERKEGECFK